MRPTLAVIVSIALVSVAASKLPGNRVLVMTDNREYEQTHSDYFDLLRNNGYELKVQISTANDLSIRQYKEFLYDHIIILAPRTEKFGGLVSSQLLTRFIDSGGNVLMALGTSNGNAIREFAADCGWEVSDSSDDAMGNVRLSSNEIIDSEAITGNARSLSFRADMAIKFDAENGLMVPILAVGDSRTQEDRFVYHAVAMQARNNARVTLLSSSDVIANARINKDDNGVFAASLTDWTFQKRGLLRVKSVHHHLVNQSQEQPFYTIRGHLHFEIHIEQLENGKWVDFCLDNMQLEFVRVDPFVRQNLKCRDGVHSVDFRIPDVHGVYTLRIDHMQPGYSRITLAQLLPIHPLRHDQYERFIPSALPYYLACFSMAIGAFFLAVVVLHHDDDLRVRQTASVAKKKD